MKLRPLWLLGLLATSVIAHPRSFAQVAPNSPAALVQQAVANDLQDRDQASYWTYHIEKTVDGQHTTEEQVETREGPVYRVVAINGKPLDAAQQSAEQDRIHRLVSDPAEQRKVKQQHDDDEAHVRKLLQQLPTAFLYDFDGANGTRVRLRFRPNPAYEPPSYEDRIFRSAAGTLTIDPQQKRLVDMQGQLIAEVEFGFGLLGRINKGGTFAISRQAVAPNHWKTNRVDVHVTGHMMLFKTVTKQQSEVRTNFHPAPGELSVQQAFDFLARK